MTYDPARRDRDAQKAAAAKYTTGINGARIRMFVQYTAWIIENATKTKNPQTHGRFSNFTTRKTTASSASRNMLAYQAAAAQRAARPDRDSVALS